MSNENKSRFKFSNSIIATIIAAIIGFIGSYTFMKLIKNKSLNLYLESNHEIILYFLILLSLVVTIYLFYISINQYNTTKKIQALNDDERYIRDMTYINKASSNIVNSRNVLLFGFVLSIVLLSNPSTLNIIVLISYLLVGSVLLIFILKHTIKVLRKNAILGNVDIDFNESDSEILEKTIHQIDEGERLIMLHALSKTYIVIINMLTLLLILLAFYQAATGENQYIGLLGITIILIYSTHAYYKKSEEFNK